MRKKTLTHISASGKAKMVDVGNKIPQQRSAIASGKIFLSANTIALLKKKAIPKGDVLTVAEIAGIQAAKKTHELIPLCHPLLITQVSVTTKLIDQGIVVESKVSCTGQTGVEMEALTAVSTALLTIYDMCKAVDKKMMIGEIRLNSKIKKNLK